MSETTLEAADILMIIGKADAPSLPAWCWWLMKGQTVNIRTKSRVLELVSENEKEGILLRSLSLKAFSPRSAGLMPDENYMLVIGYEEADEFFAGVAAVVLGEHVKTFGDEQLIYRAVLSCLKGEEGEE